MRIFATAVLLSCLLGCAGRRSHPVDRPWTCDEYPSTCCLSTADSMVVWTRCNGGEYYCGDYDCGKSR